LLGEVSALNHKGYAKEMVQHPLAGPLSVYVSSEHMKRRDTAPNSCPIKKLQNYLSAILYVDDTDILYIDLTKDKRVEDVHHTIQERVNSWGNLPITTSGVLQPNKCFYSIISFEWTNGKWKYKNNSIGGDSALRCRYLVEGRRQ
jgi:hypothetical protein